VLEILLTALVTTVGTLAVTQYSSFQDGRKRRREENLSRSFLAARMVTVLDPFVEQCAAVAGDTGTADQDGNVYSSESHPVFEVPTDIDLRSVDPLIMFRIVELPNRLADCEKILKSVSDHVATPPDHEEWFSERTYQFSKLGLIALDLATELRVLGGLPAKDYSTWDVRQHFQKWHDDEAKRREAAAESIRRMMAAHRAEGERKTLTTSQ
jgi:hypothetical protein